MTMRTLVALSLLLAACGGSETPAPADEAAETAPAAEAAEATEAAPAAEAAEATEDGDTSKAGEKSPYAIAAEALVAAIDGGKPADEVGTMATALMEMGLKELAAMRAKHPVCDPYFDALVAAAQTLPDLPLEEIESGYHADGKLPKLPDGVCYHGKDLVVHPATVVAMAKAGLPDDDARSAAKAEITEVLGHLGAVEAAP